MTFVFIFCYIFEFYIFAFIIQGNMKYQQISTFTSDYVKALCRLKNIILDSIQLIIF